MCVFFFFCKQKTAYEMRISDWSSDVCSSGLARVQGARSAGTAVYMLVHEDSEHRVTQQSGCATGFKRFPMGSAYRGGQIVQRGEDGHDDDTDDRSVERRVGKEWVSTCRFGWAASHEKKK